jgi:hypothetical protein
MSARSTLWGSLLALVALGPMIGCAADSTDAEEEDVGATDSAITAHSWKTSRVRYVDLAGLPLERGLVKVNGRVLRENHLWFLVANGEAKLDVPAAVARCIYTGDEEPAGCANANTLQIVVDMELAKARLVRGRDGTSRYDLTHRAWAPEGAKCLVSLLGHRELYGVVSEPHVFGATHKIGFECSHLTPGD